MPLSDNTAIVIIIFIILVTIGIMFLITWYTVYTSAPSVLHKKFTTSSKTDSFEYNSEMQYSESYDYNNNNSWALWQLIRLTSYISSQRILGVCEDTCGEIYTLPDYDKPEVIIGTSGNKKKKKLGMLYHHPKKEITILAFNGTSSPADWRTDMTLNLVVNNLKEENVGKIHRGFRDTYKTAKKNITELIKKYNPMTKDKGWYITGHSLGGAIATLVAYDQVDTFHSRPHVYTYGQPRVGDPEFVKDLNSKYPHGAYRILNTNDIITSLPPPVWFNNVYEHAFKEYKFSVHEQSYRKNHIQSYQTHLLERINTELE